MKNWPTKREIKHICSCFRCMCMRSHAATAAMLQQNKFCMKNGKQWEIVVLRKAKVNVHGKHMLNRLLMSFFEWHISQIIHTQNHFTGIAKTFHFGFLVLCFTSIAVRCFLYSTSLIYMLFRFVDFTCAYIVFVMRNGRQGEKREREKWKLFE